MKTSPYIKLTAIGLAAVLASCSSSIPETTRIQVSASGSNDSLSDHIYRDVNAYRNSKGKSHVKRHSGLDAIAQKHSDYLARNIGNGRLTKHSINHDGFEGRALSVRQTYRISSIGENVVTSTDHSSKKLVRLLAASRDHDHTMRNAWTYVGVGTSYTPSGLVISTQIFGTGESSSHLELSNRFNRVW